jgi:hypothetical protein
VEACRKLLAFEDLTIYKIIYTGLIHSEETTGNSSLEGEARPSGLVTTDKIACVKLKLRGVHWRVRYRHRLAATLQAIVV